MIIVKGAKNKDGQRSEDWIDHAIGEIDQFGTPFEVIELRWVDSKLHPNTDYAKTRGFDDAVISVGANGRLSITYREKTGSVQWLRGLGGHGPFIGKVARTDRNIRLLASHYRDGLWRIKDQHVDAEVRAMSDKLWESMSPELRNFNEKRIKAMHTRSNEGNVVHLPQDSEKVKAEQDRINEERRDLARQKQDLARREAALSAKEKRITEVRVEQIKNDTPPDTSDLSSLGFRDLRKLAREKYGVKVDPSWNKDRLMELIKSKAEAATSSDSAHVETPKEEGLAD